MRNRVVKNDDVSVMFLCRHAVMAGLLLCGALPVKAGSTTGMESRTPVDGSATMSEPASLATPTKHREPGKEQRQVNASTQSEAGSGDNQQWLLLRSLTKSRPHFVGVMPALPPADVRAAFPHRITIVVAYEEDEKGLPLYADDLEALNGLEDDIREWDPDRRVFLNAARSTGLGERRWILYASDVAAMEALVPENDFMDISAEHDPEWSEIAAILAGIPKAH